MRAPAPTKRSTTIVHARSRQSSMTAPSVPGARATSKTTSRLPLSVESDAGATSLGAAMGMHPEALREKPGLQTMSQADAAQLGEALGADGHALPQRPQSVALVRVSTHDSPQSVVPPVQLGAQAPAVQSMLAVHALPQRPQWAAESMRASHPLAATPSQSSKVALQRARPQTPAAHCPCPLITEQARPHAPQWEASTASSTSQPLEATPSQSA